MSRIFRNSRRFALSLLIAAISVSALRAAGPTPSPALLVLNKEDANLIIIDPASGKTVAQIPTGEAPHELAVSADGKTAYVANYGHSEAGSTISVIDLVGQKEIQKVDISPLRRPHGIAVYAGKVYFTAEDSKAIGVYDLLTQKVSRVFVTGQERSHMLAFSKDGLRLYIANIASNSMTALMRTATNQENWEAMIIALGKGPEGFSLSPDEKELWAANSGDGSISIVDPNTNKVVKKIEIGTKRSNRLKFTPNGKYVLVSDLSGGELVVLEAKSRKVIKRIAIGQGPAGILILPDGSKAYIACSGEGSLAILDLKSWDVNGHVSAGKGPDGMAWAVQK